MMTLLISKGVGDLFNIGIYDMHIELKHVPLLEWESPSHGGDIRLRQLLKNQHPIYFCRTMRVRDIVRILKMTRHSGFPVAGELEEERTPQGQPILRGFILRSTVTALLHDQVRDNGILNRPEFAEFGRNRAGHFRPA